jgi:predicted urease superfamily metal-dependent hydrolase
MTMMLTQVYLDPGQKKALAAKAKSTGRKASDLVREAVDALLLGVHPEELRQLDEASRHAEKDIRAMVKTLDANAADHRAFMAEIAALRAVEDKPARSRRVARAA